MKLLGYRELIVAGAIIIIASAFRWPIGAISETIWLQAIIFAGGIFGAAKTVQKIANGKGGPPHVDTTSGPGKKNPS